MRIIVPCIIALCVLALARPAAAQSLIRPAEAAESIGVGGQADRDLAPDYPVTGPQDPLGELSLMFTDEEMLNLKRAMNPEVAPALVTPGMAPLPLAPGQAAAASAAPPRPAMPTQPVSLGGIFYMGSDNWTIWVNGRSISAGDQDNQFTIRKVTAEKVRLSVRGGSGEITLAPRQTWYPAEEVTREGFAATLTSDDSRR